MKSQAAHTLAKRWQHLLPWLFLLLAFAFLAFPAVRMLPLLGTLVAALNLPSANSDTNPVELGTSEHFRVVAPVGYMSTAETAAFLTEAEARRAQLIAFLKIPKDDSQITLRLHPQQGTPYSNNVFQIDLYALKAGHTSLIHELTHSLMGDSNPLVSDGLAVVTEDRFGWGMSLPKFFFPSLNVPLYAYERERNELPPLEEIWKYGRMMNPFDLESSILHYLEAGSFTQYLIESYGLDKFLENYQYPNFEKTYGRPIDALERDWLAALRYGHLTQAILFSLGGLLLLDTIQLAISSVRTWSLVAIVGAIVFFVWSIYLFYWVLPIAMLAAAGIGRFVSRWNRTWGVALLWLIGVASLIVLVLAPPILAIFQN